jgi:hypothetical protein
MTKELEKIIAALKTESTQDIFRLIDKIYISKSEIDFLFVSTLLEGNLEVAKYLLDKGVDINNKACSLDSDDFGLIHLTPLIIACVKGNVEVVKFLLDNGADINILAFHGSALVYACGCGQAEVVSTLLKYNANIAQTQIMSKSAAYNAAYSGHVALLKVLFDHLKEQPDSDQNMLSIRNEVSEAACISGKSEVLKFLFLYKPIWTSWNHYFHDKVQMRAREAVIASAKHGNIENIKCLIEEKIIEVLPFGSNLSFLNDRLAEAAIQGGNIDVIKYLIQRDLEFKSVESHHYEGYESKISSKEQKVAIQKLVKHSNEASKYFESKFSSVKKNVQFLECMSNNLEDIKEKFQENTNVMLIKMLRMKSESLLSKNKDFPLQNFESYMNFIKKYGVENLEIALKNPQTIVAGKLVEKHFLFKEKLPQDVSNHILSFLLDDLSIEEKQGYINTVFAAELSGDANNRVEVPE